MLGRTYDSTEKRSSGSILNLDPDILRTTSFKKRLLIWILKLDSSFSAES